MSRGEDRALSQSGHPRRLSILHLELGAGSFEPSVHRMLDAHRAHGEWFDFGDEPAVPAALQAIADVRTLHEIAERQQLAVDFKSMLPRLLAVPAIAPAESEPAAPARERLPDRPADLPVKPCDPCENLALMQVNEGATRGFFASHPDPTGYLRGLGIPAHHIEWWYREFPKYGAKLDSGLASEAEQERSGDVAVPRMAHGMASCKLAADPAA